MQKRDSFSGKIGFILAAAGSAVGLGNLWRFPYLVARYGGGIFLLVYLVLVITFGYALMTLEIGIGRKTGLSPVGAFRAYGKKHAWAGWLTVLITLIITGYYAVIGGWVLKYIVVYIADQGAAAAADGYFNSFISRPAEPLIYALVFSLAGLAVLLGGVKGGIEKASKVLMPLLVILSVFIAVYSATLPGAIEGIKFILIPDFSNFGFETVIGAVGQMFYSMSLAMGIMLTFGSYLDKKTNIEASVSNVEIFDTGIAILAAFMIIPAVFVFSSDTAAQLDQGAGLMFVTLPKVFDYIPLGRFVGAAFFVLVAFAALTSFISVDEVIIATLSDIFHLKRVPAVLLTLGVSCLLSVPASLGFGAWDFVKIMGFSILDFMDFISNSLLLPLSGLGMCIIFGWVVGLKPIVEEIELSSKFRRRKIFEVVVKYIAPILLGAIVVTNVLQIMGIVSI